MSSATLKHNDDLTGSTGPDVAAQTPGAKIEYPLSDEQMAEKLARESPEGRPADKGLHRRGVYVALAVVVVVLVGSAALVFLIGGNPQFAIMAAVVALMAAVWSPVVWASLMRAEERGRADREHDAQVKRLEPMGPRDGAEVHREPCAEPGCLNGGRPVATESPDRWSPG